MSRTARNEEIEAVEEGLEDLYQIRKIKKY
jgi:hypothetical protein